MWILFPSGGRVKDVIKFPLLLLRPYRLGLIAANTETYSMTSCEKMEYLFTLTCIITSGMSFKKDYKPALYTSHFWFIYLLLADSYEKNA
ncbi:hypothetical protein CD006_25810 [Enterobacter sp. 10-1]|nr:hypothetical protein CD006_25810 [Enterobacter sp. 10-1]